MAVGALDWSTTFPDEPGLWWCRTPNKQQAIPVEFVATDRDPLILYHSTKTFRWLSDEWFEGSEWRGPVAKRSDNGLWYFIG